MTIQTGIGKKVAYKKETTFGTIAGASGARYLRRVTSSLDLSKDTYASNELTPTYQITDFRHGVRKVGGAINGELSPGSYLDFMQSACRRDFTVVTSLTAVSMTVATTTAINGVAAYTLTRAAGDWYAGGVRVGMVVQITTGLVNAANINRNLLVMSFTSAAVIVVIPLNGSLGPAGNTGPLVNEGPTSGTLVIPGKVTYTASSSQTNDSYSIEHYFGDITQSETFTGCRVASLEVQLPPSGMSTCAVNFMGQNMTAAAAQYFTTPTAAPTKGVVAAVNGVVKVGAIPVAILTGLNFKLDAGMTTGAVVGSVQTPDVFVGRMNVTGQFTAYFDTVAQRDAFLNETEVNIAAAFATGGTAGADFIAFAMPRCKLGGANKSDGEQGLTLTCPFQAILNTDGSVTDGDENCTLWIQDSNSAQA